MPMMSLPASRNVAERISKVMLNLIAKNSPGGDVVAVTKAAGDAQHLIIGDTAGII